MISAGSSFTCDANGRFFALCLPAIRVGAPANRGLCILQLSCHVFLRICALFGLQFDDSDENVAPHPHTVREGVKQSPLLPSVTVNPPPPLFQSPELLERAGTL